MSIEKDFIKREIQRLNLVLIALIDKANNLSGNNKTKQEEIESTMLAEFGINLKFLEKIDTNELIEKINKLEFSQVESMLKIFYETHTKTKSHINHLEVKTKLLFLIKHLDENSESFSLERMNIKNQLC